MENKWMIGGWSGVEKDRTWVGQKKKEMDREVVGYLKTGEFGVHDIWL